jgi:threonine/homoserine/homoserine lactone efflux protein
MLFDFDTFSAIIAVYALIVISPGPNFVLVTRYSLKHSVGLAFAVTFGLAIGATINALITMFGVGAMIISYPSFGLVVSIAGSGFLAYLGLSAILSTFRARAQPRLAETGPTPAPYPKTDQIAESASDGGSIASALSKGLFVNLLNPKGIVFFISLYAPLIARASPFTKAAVLATSFLIEIVWYGLVILILSRPRFRSLYDRASFAIDCVLGIVLVLLAIRILFSAGNYL